MLTAVIPSLSSAKDDEAVLTGVHNVSAPLSALIMLIMETLQLTYGEHAFGCVLDQTNATAAFGPLTTLQKFRVVVLCLAWCAVAVFFPTQGYLMLGPRLFAARYPARFPNRSLAIALLSYGGELFAMLLAALLPALAGIDMVTDAFSAGPEQMQAVAILGVFLERSGGAFYAW